MKASCLNFVAYKEGFCRTILRKKYHNPFRFRENLKMFSHAFLKLNKNESKLVHTKLYLLKVISLFRVTLSKSYKTVRRIKE